MAARLQLAVCAGKLQTCRHIVSGRSYRFALRPKTAIPGRLRGTRGSVRKFGLRSVTRHQGIAAGGDRSLARRRDGRWCGGQRRQGRRRRQGRQRSGRRRGRGGRRARRQRGAGRGGTRRTGGNRRRRVAQRVARRLLRRQRPARREVLAQSRRRRNARQVGGRSRTRRAASGAHWAGRGRSRRQRRGHAAVTAIHQGAAATQRIMPPRNVQRTVAARTVTSVLQTRRSARSGRRRGGEDAGAARSAGTETC